MPGRAHDVSSVAWYHTIELGDGVLTPGYFDLRSALARVPMPASLAGKRCLDVATCDGFWAFEMERRGAGEVVALDLDNPAAQDWPGGAPPAEAPDAGRNRRTFAIASAALGSAVERRACSIYDVSAEKLGGTFDFVFVGNVLIHVRDPVRALGAVRGVVGGELLSLEAIAPWLSLVHPRTPAAALAETYEPRWWTPNVAAYRRWFAAAGFEAVESGGPVVQRFGAGVPRGRMQPRDLAPAALLPRVLRGAVSAWVTTRG